MIKFYKILFFSSMVTGTIMAISSYSWFSMWMGLEINLLSIIPLMKSTNSIYPSESAIKYFITQALASSILLFAMILKMNLSEIFPQDLSQFNMIMNSAFFIKMGAAPFHSWFPEVLEGLNWMNCLLMLTWQKIAPMILLSYNLEMINLLSIIIISSSLIGGLLGINQISLRKIMAYSSINHIGWMIASMLISLMTWMIYFMIYSLISISIVLIFFKKNIFYLKQMASIMSYSKTMKFCFNLNFMSLGGIPPFLGFFPKWITINGLIENKMYFLSLILIVITLISLFFYLRITFSALLINTTESLFEKSKHLDFMIVSLSSISILGLVICTLIFNIY